MSSSYLLYELEPAPKPVPISKTKLELFICLLKLNKSAWKMFKSIYWKRRTSKRIMTNQLPDWYRQPDTMRFATVDHGTNRLTTSHPYRLQIADRWPPPTSTVALHGVNDDFFHAENLLSFYILSRPSENQHADTSIYVVVVDWGLTTSIANNEHGCRLVL